MNKDKISAQLENNCQLVVLAVVDSTNDEIIARARDLGVQGLGMQSLGAQGLGMSSAAALTPPTLDMSSAAALTSPTPPLVSPPLVVVSARQTAGRGRLGRSWSSPNGGVYLSVLLSLGQTDVASAASLSPLTALAVREALQLFHNDPISLKWPNDVLSSKGKLAGILVELKQSSAVFLDAPTEHLKNTWLAVMGIGINVSHSGSEPSTDGYAYLSDNNSSTPQREDVAAAVINSLIRHYTVWQAAQEGFTGFVSHYQTHLQQIGQAITVRDALGAEIASGVVCGVDEEGRLILRADTDADTDTDIDAVADSFDVHEKKTIHVAAGEITLRNEVALVPRGMRQ